MKKHSMIASGLFTILVIVITALASLSGPYEEQPAPEPEPPPPIEELIPGGERTDNETKLRVLHDGEIAEMTMEMYLIGVVSAEMPASFELEALKAQSVAARTNALHYISIADKKQHPDASVCTDPSCCTAFYPDDLLRRRWGSDYVRNITRIISAVIGTDGVFMSYEDEPVLAVFHSSSAGKTETSGNVWLTDLPYLLSVDSPETAEQVPNYIAIVNITRVDFLEKVLETHPDAIFDNNSVAFIGDIVYTESGRVFELSVGGAVVKGTELRSMFNLRSTAFTVEINDDEIIITTTGFGHGVGMSQYGANVMASDATEYIEILHHYYTGVNIN